MEDKELLEMPIEIINPGNGLPDAPPCAPFSAALPCQNEFGSGCNSLNPGGVCDCWWVWIK